MVKSRPVLLLCLLALATGAQARSFGSVEFEPCTLSSELGLGSVEAQCAGSKSGEPCRA